jgi:hypothetical protein
MAEHLFLRTMACHHLHVLKPGLVELESAHARSLCYIFRFLRLDGMDRSVGCIPGVSPATGVGRTTDVVTVSALQFRFCPLGGFARQEFIAMHITFPVSRMRPATNQAVSIMSLHSVVLCM